MSPVRPLRLARPSVLLLEDRTVPAVVGHEFVSKAVFSHPGLREGQFNSRLAPVRIAISNEAFLIDPSRVSLKINGSIVPSTSLRISAREIRADGVLVDGKNEIRLDAVNSQFFPVSYSTMVWAGSNTVRVSLAHPDGQPLKGMAVVTAKLGDDQSIVKRAVAVNGTAVLKNLPGRTIFFEAKAGKSYGFVGAFGGDATTRIVMNTVGAPSPVDNNDFSLGTDGWNIGTAPVEIVDGGAGRLRDPVNKNLILHTSGEGEQVIFRTFHTEKGVSNVSLRYRFITSEVPGGYFGSRFNDYFRVTLRGGVKQSSDSNSMNGLGLAAFDFATGTTAWREVTFKVNPKGDVVQAEVAVANVADGLLDSAVEVDLIEEKKAQFHLGLKWNTTAEGGVNLTYKVLGDIDVKADTPVKVYWATGPDFNSKIAEVTGAEVTVPAGTKAGTSKTVRIPGESLQDAPAETRYILVATDETDAASRPDVAITFNSGIDGSVLGATTLRVLKNLGRIAGQKTIRISSTARTIESQVAAMFDNLTKTPNIVANVAAQNAIYDANGEAVIAVFAAKAAALGDDLNEVLANAAAIKQQMVDKIVEIKQTNPNAFKHTIKAEDYAKYNVMDVPLSSFTNALTRAHFKAAAAAVVTKLLDENGVLHLEITQ